MKKFKEFKSEQQYVTEIGPIAATLMGAMALWGGYQAFKKVKSKWKGYKETKQEKKDNKEAGVSIELKVFNPETGKTDVETEMISPPGDSASAISNEDALKIQKKKQLAQDTKNKIAKNAYQEKEKGAKGERGGIEDVEDAEEFFVNNGKSPPGWEDIRTPSEKIQNVDIKGKIMTKADAKKFREKHARLAKQSGNESYMLKFGEFIAEDIMKDLKKAAKSKKDVEITLDDGADIPIDPITADIFVKYIEGLSSSEKRKTIKQIQRTERGYMKGLGKAHEG